MSLPSLNHSAIAVDPGTESFHEAGTIQKEERGADASLTARAIIAVTFGGAGIWYLLWKLALIVVAGR